MSMTTREVREELEQIRDDGAYRFASGAEELAGQLAKALLAVLGIHKRVPGDRDTRDSCHGCELDWPCPTAQAIEREMGVDRG